MNRSNRLFINRFKFLSLDGLAAYVHPKISLNIITTNKRLSRLCGLLKHWNIQRVSNNNINTPKQPLSVEDIHSLKTLIRIEINKTNITHQEVIADQILFWTIGAIQIESQNGTNAAWELVDKTILGFNKPVGNQFYAFGFLSMLLIMLLSMIFHKPTNMQPIESAPLNAFSTTKVVNRTDPVTLSMLHRAYAKMRAGTCRLPQPEMLPPEQQHAFLMFMNHNAIDVHHVENLRLAIDYVNCLYPQEFLHPTPSYGNTL
jgi:hypothetical protein